MKKINPSVIEFLSLKHQQVRPQLGILLSNEKSQCWTVLTNGHLFTHGLNNIRLVLSDTDQFLKEFNSEPLHPPGLSMKTLEKLDKIPEILGAIKDLEAESLKKGYLESMPLQFTKSKYDIDELTREFRFLKSDTSNNFISSKWATYQTILKSQNLFRIYENPLKGMEIECFSKDQTDFLSSIGYKEGELLEFIRKCLDKSIHNSWSEFELKIIDLLKKGVIASKKYPDIHKKIAFDILRKTEKYLPIDSDLIVFLKDSGLVAPWETFLQRSTGLCRFADVPVRDEERITKEFEDEYSDKLLNGIKTLENSDGSLSFESIILPEKYSWVSPSFVPEGGILDMPFSRDVCSHIRKDFGDLPVYIIDADSAHEIDDGISIEHKPDGVWIHTHVADPTVYMQANHPLSLFAQLRHSSIYFPDNHLPLIPPKLTDEIFNLGKSPFAVTFSAKMDSKGDILDYTVQPSIIKNVMRISYSRADHLIDEIENDTQDQVASRDLKEIKKLMEKHIQYRTNQGAINADSKGEVRLTPYPFIDPSKSWNPPEKYPRIYIDNYDLKSRTMVSECMIIAGRIGARFFTDKKIPAIYRVQEHPKLSNQNDIKDFQSIMDKKDPITGVLPIFESRKLGRYVRGAASSTHSMPHFAMGLDENGYLKLTSPLRRYTDLILHWNLKAYWSKTKFPFSEDDILSMIPRQTILDNQLKYLSHHSTRFWLYEWIRRRQVLYKSPLVNIDQGILPHESEFGIPRAWTWNLKTNKHASEYPSYKAIILEIVEDRRLLKVCLPSLAYLINPCFYVRNSPELYVGNSINVRVFNVDPGMLELKLDYIPGNYQ